MMRAEKLLYIVVPFAERLNYFYLNMYFFIISRCRSAFRLLYETVSKRGEKGFHFDQISTY